MKALRLLRISLTVRDLAAAGNLRGRAWFGCIEQDRAADPAVVMLLGAGAIRTTLMQRGNQLLELAASIRRGGIPAGQSQQRFVVPDRALVRAHIDAAYVRLNRIRIRDSRNGPQALPDGERRI